MVDTGQHFYKLLARHERYKPETVKKSGGLTQKNNSYTFAMIRKACKFGLEYVTQHTGSAKIHFLVGDGDAWEDVVKKKVVRVKDESNDTKRVPITVSELRWVFRNWEKVKLRVKFYDSSLNLRPAPWESDPEAWREYALARIEKYKKKAKTKSAHAVPQAEIRDADLMRLVRWANDLKKISGDHSPQ